MPHLCTLGLGPFLSVVHVKQLLAVGKEGVAYYHRTMHIMIIPNTVSYYANA